MDVFTTDFNHSKVIEIKCTVSLTIIKNRLYKTVKQVGLNNLSVLHFIVRKDFPNNLCLLLGRTFSVAKNSHSLKVREFTFQDNNFSFT